MASEILPYKVITDKILEKLEEGTVPWHQPWSTEMSKNLVSKKEYRGINVFLLASMGYANPYWLTFRQAGQLGGHIRRGEKSTPVVFWKWMEKNTGDLQDNGDAIVNRYPILRHYKVFNLDQCDDIPADKIPELEKREDFHPIGEAEAVVRDMPHAPTITNGSRQALYRPSTDSIEMPPGELFGSDEEYYSTLFHELTHSTGHRSRLHRFNDEELSPFGSGDYSKEELIAEMGAAFLCGHCQIVNETIDNSAAYIQGWLGKLRNDKKLVVIAGAQAQKAADSILSRYWKNSQKV